MENARKQMAYYLFNPSVSISFTLGLIKRLDVLNL
jgi:hypothetical protein